MTVKHNPSALALVISANAVVSSRGGAELANRVVSSYREEGGDSDNRGHVKQSHQQPGPGVTTDAHMSENYPDAGLLGERKGRTLFASRRNHRHLQIASQLEEPCPKPDTCEPGLCQCVSENAKGFLCAEELHNVCNGVIAEDGTKFTIDGCVYYPDYYMKTWCPFAECIVNGESYESCDCRFYQTYCDIYGEMPQYQNKPATILNCNIAACCSTKNDDIGRGMCLDSAPTSVPSTMPSEPTVAPTTASPNSAPIRGAALPPQGTPPPPPGSPQSPPNGTPAGTTPASDAIPGGTPNAPAMIGVPSPSTGTQPNGSQPSASQSSGSQEDSAQYAGGHTVEEDEERAGSLPAAPVGNASYARGLISLRLASFFAATVAWCAS